MAGPTLLLADEPTSGLDRDEAARLAEVLRVGQREGGLAVLARRARPGDGARLVCDRVVVLHLGRVIADGDFASVMADPVVRRAYLGRVA